MISNKRLAKVLAIVVLASLFVFSPPLSHLTMAAGKAKSIKIGGRGKNEKRQTGILSKETFRLA